MTTSLRKKAEALELLSQDNDTSARFQLNTGSGGSLTVPFSNLELLFDLALQEKGAATSIEILVARRSELEDFIRGKTTLVTWYMPHQVGIFGADIPAEWVRYENWMTDSATQVAEQIQAQIRRLRSDSVLHYSTKKWLVFEGAEAADLLRRVLHMENKPVLMVHCQRGPGMGESIYEGFAPSSGLLLPGKKLVRVSGNLGTLSWSPDVFWHPNGRFISHISTLPECFPREAFDKVKVQALGF